MENQLENARRHCQERGLVLAEENVLTEIATGTEEHQVRSNELLECASRPGRSFDLVVFTSLSRMTRGGVEAALYTLHRLESAGVGWHFVEQPILDFESTTPKLAKDIVLAVLAAIDEDYRRRISLATKAAFVRRKNLEAGADLPRWGRHPKACGCPKHLGKRGPLLSTKRPASQGKRPDYPPRGEP
ncbi:resolvase-like protein [mine drainage metagenome]|uniref:Resolvase-like protein n=1 Tax=mine drainage metagenome TaxID=410659 RepID=T1BDU2_9ZZZZ